MGRVGADQVLSMIRLIFGGVGNTDIVRVTHPILEHHCIEALRVVLVGHGDRMILVGRERHGADGACIVGREHRRCFFSCLTIQLVGNAVAVHLHLCDGIAGRFAANPLGQIDVARPGCRGIIRTVAHGQDGIVVLTVCHLRTNRHLNLLRAQAILIVRIVPDLLERQLHSVNAVGEAEGVTRLYRCHGEVAATTAHNLIANQGFLDDIFRLNIVAIF